MVSLLDFAVGNARYGIENVDPAFGNALLSYVQANPGLQLYSGWRSHEKQKALFEASDKSGRMVAPPGRSRHESGQAADLSYYGKRIDRLEPAQIEALHKSASDYGLYFPMSYEPWHVQLAGQNGPLPRDRPPSEGVGSTGGAGGVPFTPPALAPFQGGTDNPIIAGLLNQKPSDWLRNESYSGDAVLGDLFSGRNPLKRYVYQRISGLLS